MCGDKVWQCGTVCVKYGFHTSCGSVSTLVFLAWQREDPDIKPTTVTSTFCHRTSGCNI